MQPLLRYRQHILRLFRQDREGILMMDVLLGLAIFSIFVGFIVVAMLFSQRGLLVGGDRMRAVFLSQRALEGVKAVRDGSYAALTAGTHGVRLGTNGKWELSGTGVVTSDHFVTSVTLVPDGTKKMKVTTTTSWDFGPNRSGAVELHTTFADWRTTKAIGNWGTVALQGSYVDAGNPLFNNAIANENYAYVTSEVAGGAGLYIFDISNLASPLRVNAGFSIGASAYDVAIGNGLLYVSTSQDSGEIQIYDITNPLTLSTANLVGTINISGSGRARALAFYNNTLFVTATEDSTQAEFYAFDVENPASVSVADSLDDTASYLDVHLHEGYAYVASSSDTLELRVIDVFNPQDLQFAPGNGYNLTDTPNANAVVTFGNYAILGRANGDAIEEFVLFDISASPVPTPPPGPWYMNAGEGVNSLDVDPSGTYAFAATNLTTAEFRVIDIATFAAGGSPLTGSYNTTSGQGRGVYYSPELDRVFLMTNKGFLILRPS